MNDTYEGGTIRVPVDQYLTALLDAGAVRVSVHKANGTYWIAAHYTGCAPMRYRLWNVDGCMEIRLLRPAILGLEFTSGKAAAR